MIMKISVKVKPNSKTSEVVKVNEKEYIAKVKACPKDNKANIELSKLISAYFNVPNVQVRILRGAKSKTKLLEIIK